MANLDIIFKNFSKDLLAWNTYSNNRQMPWKGEPDPYKIWLSEIILQQTRVEQGMSYYLKFIEAYPTVTDLANASSDEVYKLWEGLGYYSRCKNLLETARFIATERKGMFPQTYEELIKLKGVGPYTAAAIASFAFKLPYAVADGNVYRILSRITANDTPIDSTQGKVYFSGLANQLIDKGNPDKYNQAIMDFGATVCKPAAPLCNTCIFNNSCYALKTGQVNMLPVKSKKLKVKKRFFTYLLIHYKDRIAIRKRKDKDIWHNLFEYLLIETESLSTSDEILELASKTGMIDTQNSEVEIVPETFTQQLTHQMISCRFIKVRLHKKPKPRGDLKWILRKETGEYAFPGVINEFHKRNNVESGYNTVPDT